MFSFLKGLIKPNSTEIHINRIAALMSHFEEYGVRHKLDIVILLNADFNLNIPTDLPDPEGRVWGAPEGSNLRIGFNCGDPHNQDLVTSFMFIGIDQLSGVLIMVSSGDGGETFSWSIGISPGVRSVSVLAQQVIDSFWRIPGYKKVELFNDRFLIKTMNG